MIHCWLPHIIDTCSLYLWRIGGKVRWVKYTPRSVTSCWEIVMWTSRINPLKPNDPYRVRTAPLNSKRCILYIYSTNIGTEHFKLGIYSPFFSSSKCSLFHNSNIFGSCIIHILYTWYILYVFSLFKMQFVS
jgi:hypothetical protein